MNQFERMTAFFFWLLLTPALVAIHLAEWVWDILRGTPRDSNEGD